MKSNLINDPTALTLKIQGMTCPSCARHVQEALASVPGVVVAKVPGWQSGKARVKVETDVSPQAILDSVTAAGYLVQLPDQLLPAQSPPRTDPAPSLQFHISDANDFDLIVIGSGGGGMAAAIRGAELGHQVAIIEAGTIGGTCVNIGCVPSKILIRAAEQAHRAEHSAFSGVHTQTTAVDWPAIRAQKEALVTQLRQEKYVDVLAAYPNHITLIHGRARLTSDRKVVVGDRELSARGVIIASGARPRILPIPDIMETGVLDSTSAMDMETLPKTMIVIGGRSVALELGQLFSRLGVAVTLLQRSPRILPAHEPEIAEALTNYLRNEGMSIYTDVELLSMRREDGQKVVEAEVAGENITLWADEVLMAVGRSPNTAGMGLETAGVALDDSGFILVDDQLRTNIPGVYAVGDVTTLPKFVYTAAAAGGVAASNALDAGDGTLNLTGMPAVVFTDPAVASTGLTETEARQQGYAVKTSILEMKHVPRALAAFDTRGFIKLVADTGADQLLGAHILAPEAGEMIQTTSLVLRFGIPLSGLKDALFPYLTNVEGIKLATLAFEKDPSMLSCCAG